jgi:hypothetical protein
LRCSLPNDSLSPFIPRKYQQQTLYSGRVTSPTRMQVSQAVQDLTRSIMQLVNQPQVPASPSNDTNAPAAQASSGTDPVQPPAPTPGPLVSVPNDPRAAASEADGFVDSGPSTSQPSKVPIAAIVAPSVIVGTLLSAAAVAAIMMAHRRGWFGSGRQLSGHEQEVRAFSTKQAPPIMTCVCSVGGTLLFLH